MKKEAKSTSFQAMLTEGKKIPIVENYDNDIDGNFQWNFFPEVGALCGTMVGLFRSHGLLNLGHKEALFLHSSMPQRGREKHIPYISKEGSSLFLALLFVVALKVSANTVSRESYIDGGGG